MGWHAIKINQLAEPVEKQCLILKQPPKIKVQWQILLFMNHTHTTNYECTHTIINEPHTHITIYEHTHTTIYEHTHTHTHTHTH